MRNTIIKKENGEVEILRGAELINSLKKEPTNPCSNCRNCYASMCPKVEDVRNKDIRKYDFITDGYQVYDENGVMDRFIVSKCNNYEKDLPRKKTRTKEEYLAYRRLFDSLKILAFDGVDVREADRIQRHQVLCGNLSDVDGEFISQDLNKSKSHR